VIVTRHRRRRAHPWRFAGPLLVLVALGGALALPPVQQKIANSPLRPLWIAAGGTGATLARPLTFAAQQQTITDRNREIRTLDAQLETQRKAQADRDAQIQQLQRRLAAAQNVPRPTPVPPAPVTPAPDAFGSRGNGEAPALQGGAPASDDDKRLAATWAAMEPENAAALIERLPDAEVTRVLAVMDPDSAGAIMDALPPAAAARISPAAAQVRGVADR
jgi:flagellar motility protein MotE (MotC chaperone)